MNASSLASAFRYGVVVLSLAMASGCGGLLGPATPAPTLYALDMNLDGARTAANKAPTPADSMPTLVISPTRASPGFDSSQMIYIREPYQLAHFAHSEWLDAPARMLGSIIVASIASTGTFRAVGPAAAGFSGSMRLDTEVLRLQQEFGDGPSRVRFTLRAYLLDSATRRVLAFSEFDESVVSNSEDPYGGVVAANKAVRAVMQRLAGFCTETVRSTRN